MFLLVKRFLKHKQDEKKKDFNLSIAVNRGVKYCMLQTTTKVKQNEAELKINVIKRLFCTALADKTKFIMLINCDG